MRTAPAKRESFLSNRGKKSRTQRKTRPRQTSSPKIKPLQSIGKLSGIFVSLVSFIITLIVFFNPRMSLTVGDPSKSGDPFSCSAKVTNTGYVTLRAVRLELGIDSIFQKSNQRHPSLSGFSLTTKNWPSVDLPPDEMTEEPLNQLIGLNTSTLGKAAIEVIVDYRVWFWPGELRKRFYLRSYTQTDGLLHWYAGTG